MVVVDVREYGDNQWLNIRTSEMVKGEKVSIPFEIKKDKILAPYKYEKYDSATKKIVRQDKYEPGFSKVYYREIYLVDMDVNVVYKFSSTLNDAFLARVAELLINKKDVEDTTFVLYVNKFGDKNFNVRYSIFIDNGEKKEETTETTNPLKKPRKLLQKSADLDKIITDVLREFNYEISSEAIQYVKDNVSEITREAVAEFLRSVESEE